MNQLFVLVVLFFSGILFCGFTFTFWLVIDTPSSDGRIEFSVKTADKRSVTLLLKNISNDTIVFLTQSCDHNGLFTVVDEKVMTNLMSCNISKPILLRIPPHGIDEEHLLIMSVQNDGSYFPFRVIANLVEPKEKYNPLKAFLEEKPKKFHLWTDFIHIP